MNYLLSVIILFFFQAEVIRLDLHYDLKEQELQISVNGKDQIKQVQIFAGKNLIAEFSSEDIPTTDNIIRNKMPCPPVSKLTYLITLTDGSLIRIKRKGVDLSKDRTYIEIEEPRK